MFVYSLTAFTPPDWYSEHMALRGASPMVVPWNDFPLETQIPLLIRSNWTLGPVWNNFCRLLSQNIRMKEAKAFVPWDRGLEEIEGLKRWRG